MWNPSFNGQLLKKATNVILVSNACDHVQIEWVSRLLESKIKSLHSKTFSVILLRIIFVRAFFLSTKEPTQKKACGGDKFADSHYCDQNSCQPIMVVLLAKPLVTAPLEITEKIMIHAIFKPHLGNRRPQIVGVGVTFTGVTEKYPLPSITSWSFSESGWTLKLKLEKKFSIQKNVKEFLGSRTTA